MIIIYHFYVNFFLDVLVDKQYSGGGGGRAKFHVSASSCLPVHNAMMMMMFSIKLLRQPHGPMCGWSMATSVRAVSPTQLTTELANAPNASTRTTRTSLPNATTLPPSSDLDSNYCYIA